LSLLLLVAATARTTNGEDIAALDRAGSLAWRDRARGYTAGVVDPEPVERAIEIWERELVLSPDDAALRFRLIEALYFAGHFAARDRADQRARADRALELAEETYDRVLRTAAPAAPLRDLAATTQAELERDLPDAAPAHFWCAISWGVWAMAHGNLGAARRDAAGHIRRHAEVLIALDPRYADAGGLRLLGRLHTATPKVPFVTGWIDRRRGTELLQRAHEISTRDPRNALFLAEALLEHAPDRRMEAIALLREVAARSPAPESLIEETETIDAARRRLAVEERP
jgi:hypothetical protein